MRRYFLLTLLVSALVIPAFTLAEEPTNSETEPEAVKAIDWQKLAEFLPSEIEGMETGEIDGGTMNMGNPSNPSEQISYSMVELTYTSGEGDDAKEITLRIMDTGFNQFLAAPFMMAFEYDSPDGAMKSTEVSGLPAKLILEKENNEVTNTQFMLLISERLMVNGEGNEATSTDEVESSLKMIDFEGLGKLTE